jgi:hypothetical protein
MIRFLLIILLFFNANSYAKETEKKIKFHPPETEAEKVLGYILMHKEDKNNKITKEYKQDLDNQLEKYTNSEDCKKLNEDCSPWDCDHLLCAQDLPYGFAFHTEKKTKKESHIVVELIWSGDYRTYVKYIMKNEINHIKQDIWKLDGICCKHSVLINCPYQPPKYSNEEGDK